LVGGVWAKDDADAAIARQKATGRMWNSKKDCAWF
jgi:hypothetical protein